MTKPKPWLLVTMSLSLTACVLGPNPVSPSLPVPESFQTQIQVTDGSTSLAWWTGFSDTVLSDLIDTAVSSNFDVRIAVTQLQQARSLQRASRSDLLPGLDAFIESQWTTKLSGASSQESSQTAGAAFGFDTDLFGGLRRSLQAANANLAGAAVTVADLQRLVARAVALRYIDMRRAQARLALLETTLELQTRTLEIVQSRQRAGLSPKLDVDRAASDLSSSRAQQGSLVEDQQNAEYALAVLLGESPRRAMLATPTHKGNKARIPKYRVGPPIGLPADLLRRRPDVRAAEFALIAEIALIGVETADLYPRLTLPGVIQADIGSVSSIADMATATIGAMLELPLLDGGRRRAEVAAQQARAEQALLQYQRILLLSLQEVESALVRIETLLDRQRNLGDAVAASQSAFEQLDALYREGLAGFIDVLDVQRTLIASEQNYIESEADLAGAYVGLYAALGYGEQLQTQPR